MNSKKSKMLVSLFLVFGLVLSQGAFLFADVDELMVTNEIDDPEAFMITITVNSQQDLQDALNLAAVEGGSVEYIGVGAFFIYNNLTIPEGVTLYLRTALGNLNLQASARVYNYGKIVLETGKQIINNGGIIYNYGEMVIDGNLSLQTGTLNNYAGALIDATNGTISQVGNRIGVDEGVLIPLSKFGRYTITFEDWDGTVLKSQIAIGGAWVTAPANPSRKFCEFIGWDTALGTNGYYVTANPGDRVIKALYQVPQMITITVNSQQDLQDALNLAATVGGSVEYIGVGAFFIYNNLTIPEGVTLYLRTALGNLNLQASARVYNYGKIVLETGKQIINNGGIIYNYGEMFIDGNLSLQTGTLNNYAGALIDATNGTISQVGNRIGVDEGVLIPLSKFGRYTITFEDWDGTVLKSQIAVGGTWVAAPAAPSRQFYVFTGWDTALGTNGYYVTASPGDRVIKALYEPFGYMVTYFANGGSFASTGEETMSGSSYWYNEILYPEDPVRDGYIFIGWFTQNDIEVARGTTYCELVDGDSDLLSESIWAKWEEIVLVNLTTSKDGFISIEKKPGSNKQWMLSFEVTETYSNGESRVVVYSIEIESNNANVSGSYYLGDYTLLYDIKGNGSNIKELEIIR